MDQGKTGQWEQHVSKLAALMKQRNQLFSADYLSQLKKKHDEAYMLRVAKAAGMPAGTARPQAWVSETFPLGHRIRELGLKYSYLKALAGTDDPIEWGTRAVANHWNVGKLAKEIARANGKDVSKEAAAPREIKRWENLQPHPTAAIFPLLEDEEYNQLCRDIAANGLVEPIWMYQGQILDGRNRYRACLDMEVKPHFQEYRGEDPLGHAVTLNVQRRHLDESQRAWVAAKIANLKQGQRADASIDGSAVTQADAAKRLNVSLPSVQRAAKVRDNGIDAVITAVEKREMVVSAAAALVELPQEQQQELLIHLRQEGGKITAARVQKANQQRAAAPITAPLPEEPPQREDQQRLPPDGTFLLDLGDDLGWRERPPSLCLSSAADLTLVAQELAGYYSPAEWAELNRQVMQRYVQNGAAS